MANVIMLAPNYFVVNPPLQPGARWSGWMGPMDAFRNSTITVTAQPYEPVFETTAMAVEEIALQWKTDGNRIIYFVFRNSGSVPIRSFYMFTSTVGA